MISSNVYFVRCWGNSIRTTDKNPGSRGVSFPEGRDRKQAYLLNYIPTDGYSSLCQHLAIINGTNANIFSHIFFCSFVF